MSDEIKEYGMTEDNGIQTISIIGEIEGHDCLSQNAKTTKYEHLLPLLAKIEQNDKVKGVLFLMNTVGGDVSCGLALAEMISSLSKPTVSLIIGDSHSIGVPLAVSTDYSFIVPSATMIIHPVRMNGMVLGTPQTYSQFQQIQDRIINFIASHSQAEKNRLEELMMNTSMLSKDLGTVLVGKDAVVQGLIKEVGGINRALAKLYQLIKETSVR
ncbi:MAG: ATP-dependent Clp protease proteolytic subunit [Eubacterium sp.]|nr:ATP-dependent Clp protease proteolytic subunit [Eubacterium sp.]